MQFRWLQLKEEAQISFLRSGETPVQVHIWSTKRKQKLDQAERVPTNLRALLILEVVGNSDAPVTPTQIANLLALPKQTIHRVCNTLVEEGFLARADNERGLRPARRLRDIATGILQASRYHIIRHQILVEVANEIGETVNFVMPEDDGMNYVDRVETDWPFRVQLPIGTHVPFHCTASGKTFLAKQPKKIREQLVRSLTLTRNTENTIIDPDHMLDELHMIAKQGYAIDNEEFMEGMVALAVPVLDPKKRFVAALAYHGPSMRIDVKTIAKNVPVLEAAASRISSATFENKM